VQEDKTLRKHTYKRLEGVEVRELVAVNDKKTDWKRSYLCHIILMTARAGPGSRWPGAAETSPRRASWRGALRSPRSLWRESARESAADNSASLGC